MPKIHLDYNNQLALVDEYGDLIENARFVDYQEEKTVDYNDYMYIRIMVDKGELFYYRKGEE